MPEKGYFARNLRKFREANQLTQFEAAEDMGLCKETISNIEREKKNITVETVQKAAAYMGITVSQLLCDWEEIGFEPPIIK